MEFHVQLLQVQARQVAQSRPSSGASTAIPPGSGPGRRPATAPGGSCRRPPPRTPGPRPAGGSAIRPRSPASRSPTRRPRWMRNSMLCSPFSDVGRTSEYTLPCGVTPPMTDRWSRVCHSSHDRRLPFGGVGLDHPRQQVEPRFVHENKDPALAAGLLLQLGPRLDPPALDRLFVPLDGPGDRDLRGPSQSLEQARHLALAVRDAELLVEDSGDPLTASR